MEFNLPKKGLSPSAKAELRLLKEQKKTQHLLQLAKQLRLKQRVEFNPFLSFREIKSIPSNTSTIHQFEWVSVFEELPK